MQNGDPEGRRLASRRAARLAEAGRLVRMLEVLLQQARFDTGPCRGLAESIAAQEQIELQRAYGRIESRKRFKHKSGHSLLEPRCPSLLFIDENGKGFPEPHIPNAVFTLGAVAVDVGAEAVYAQAADEIKHRFFGRADFTFHEPEMRRRERHYYFGGDRQRQAEFDLALDELVQSTPFTAFGVGIRKTAFAASDTDPYLPTDIYAAAIMMLMERYVDFLYAGPEARRGRVAFESQGPKEDAIHQLEYARLLVDGTQWVPESAFRQLLEPGISFTPKVGSHPMELADMFSRDLFEWITAGCVGSPGRWDLFSSKVYLRGDGQMGKFGVKVFPDHDVRDQIEDHRSAASATDL